jgi:hypothetical protein
MYNECELMPVCGCEGIVSRCLYAHPKQDNFDACKFRWNIYCINKLAQKMALEEVNIRLDLMRETDK